MEWYMWVIVIAAGIAFAPVVLAGLLSTMAVVALLWVTLVESLQEIYSGLKKKE